MTHTAESGLPGIKWGEDFERDCAELRRLESWGLYAHGHHDQVCPIDHAARVTPPEVGTS